MKLILHAQIGTMAFAYRVQGTVLFVNEAPVDLAQLDTEGDYLLRTDFADQSGEVPPFIAGAARFEAGEIVVPVIRTVPKGHPSLEQPPEEIRVTAGSVVL